MSNTIDIQNNIFTFLFSLHLQKTIKNTSKYYFLVLILTQNIFHSDIILYTNTIDYFKMKERVFDQCPTLSPSK